MPDTLGVFHQRGAVRDDGVHDGPPAHPELFGHNGDGEGELAHLAGGFGAGTQRQYGPSRHMGGLVGSGLGVAVAVRAAPASLQPDEASRPAEAGQVPDVDALAFVGESADPTARASHDVGRRLDADPQLVGELVGSSVVRGLLRCRLGTQQRCRDLWPRSRMVAKDYCLLRREEPVLRSIRSALSWSKAKRTYLSAARDRCLSVAIHSMERTLRSSEGALPGD